MARAGHGVALLASWLVHSDVREGTLVSLFDDCELPPAPIQALIPPTRYVHPRVRGFLDYMSTALRGDGLAGGTRM